MEEITGSKFWRTQNLLQLEILYCRDKASRNKSELVTTRDTIDIKHLETSQNLFQPEIL